MKKFGRKLLGLCLAASLAVTAVPPAQGLAAQGSENESAVQAETPEAGEPETEETGEAGERESERETGDIRKPDTEPGAEAVPPTDETEGAAVESGNAQEPGTGEMQPAESTEMPGLESEPGDGQRPDGKQEGVDPDLPTGPEMPEDETPADDTQSSGESEGEENTRRQEAEEGGIMALADSYDINQPVIEKFEFLENGQALTKNDTLHFKVWAYDADSGIESVQIVISSNGTSYVTCTKAEERNLYVGTLSCDRLHGTNFFISSVRVVDRAGNKTDLAVRDEKGQCIYTFTADCGTTTPPRPSAGSVSISNVQMRENDLDGDGKLGIGDTVTYTADVVCKDTSFSSATMELLMEAPGYSTTQTVRMTYDEEMQRLTGTYEITDKTYPAEWRLYKLRISTDPSGVHNFYSYNWNSEKKSFIVVRDDFDAERPVIENITIDKNGQFVTAGDVVTITVKVSEEHPVETAKAVFSPMISNVVVSQPEVILKLNPDTNEYTGTIDITDDTYPCEWDLTALTVYDKIGHRTYLRDFRDDVDRTYPWYYRVKAGNTYAEDMKDVPIKIYGRAQQEDGTIVPDSLLFDGVVKDVGRRASIEELGILQQPLEGNAPSGWKYNNNKVADADTKFIFPDAAACTFTACYDKGCANVALTYMTLSGETKTVNVPVFVDREASFRDVLDALKLPEDARTGDFDGFELSGADEDTKVGDVANLSVSTNYAGTQVACTLHYFDRYGSPVSRQDSRTYPAGTRLSDVLAGLETPEDVSGAAFEKWILPDYEGDADDVPGSSLQLDVTAVYRGKTTVDTLLAYRGTDGKMAEVKKMVLADGEDPSDADLEGQATGAFKDAEHYKGLRLSEWKGNTTKKLEQYREIDFTAVYYNCFITMRYPDGSREYAVADKGASFRLPSENETYRNIVWEGYGAGAAVKVTGDMEFTVADAERKGGETPPETTGGVRLTEEEIEEIVKKAQEASDGETVRVDMGKATVIPKEVLEAIRDRSVAVVLDMGTYSWTVNGLDVLATEQRDIDLEVKVDTDAVPPGLVQELAGDSPARQLSLTHDGDFGFRADLTLNLGSGHAGGTGNLYYYDSTGKLVFISSGGIAEDGTTSLSFSHASDYVIVIGPGKTSAEPEETPSGPEETPSGPEMPSGGKEDGGSDVREPSARVRDDASEAEVPGGTDEGSNDDASGGAPSAGTDGNGSAERRPGSGRMRSPRTGE